MSNTFFAFRQFTIHQDQCAMKVGTDGVLLGAWTSVDGTKRILDAGTGTGLIALMLAQRSLAFVDAVELDARAAAQALKNIRNSPWPNRIRVFNDSFQHFAACSAGGYDLVVANPPYFRQSLKPADQVRTLARHDDAMNYEELLHFAVKILSPQGRLSVIIPSDAAGGFLDKAWLNNLFPLRVTNVRTKTSGDPVRTLLDLSTDRQHEAQHSELTIMQEDGKSYTDDYKQLTDNYYL